MSGEFCGSPIFTNRSTTEKCPACGISQRDDHIRINLCKLCSKSFKLRDKFGSDVLGLDKGRIPGDAFGFCSTEELHLVAGGMEVEDVGEEAIGAVDASVFEHAGELLAGVANEGGAGFLFGFAPSLSDDGYVSQGAPTGMIAK